MDESWSIVIPYYNEEDFLPATLASLLAQTLKPFRLILVDNGSTDASAQICREMAGAAEGVTAVFLDEARQGQVHALQAGLARVETEFVAICDADTVYPPHYLAKADDVFRTAAPDVVAVLGLGVQGEPDGLSGRLQRAKGVAMGAILARQCHAGGYGHCFRTDALRRAGGYDKALWPYVLKDHELMHRMFKQGRGLYDFALWCRPSPRRADRTSVRWTLPERLVYHLTPFRLKDWFFYTFLAGRLKARKLDEINLRQRSWG